MLPWVLLVFAAPQAGISSQQFAWLVAQVVEAVEARARQRVDDPWLARGPVLVDSASLSALAKDLSAPEPRVASVAQAMRINTVRFVGSRDALRCGMGETECVIVDDGVFVRLISGSLGKERITVRVHTESNWWTPTGVRTTCPEELDFVFFPEADGPSWYLAMINEVAVC
jgi:hypothetical protein